MLQTYLSHKNIDLEPLQDVIASQVDLSQLKFAHSVDSQVVIYSAADLRQKIETDAKNLRSIQS